MGYIAPTDREREAQARRELEVVEALNKAMASRDPRLQQVFAHTWANGGKPVGSEGPS